MAPIRSRYAVLTVLVPPEEPVIRAKVSGAGKVPGSAGKVPGGSMTKASFFWKAYPS